MTDLFGPQKTAGPMLVRYKMLGALVELGGSATAEAIAERSGVPLHLVLTRMTEIPGLAVADDAGWHITENGRGWTNSARLWAGE